MIKDIVNSFKDFYLSMGVESPKVMLFLTLVGIIALVLGYIRYKWIGLILSLIHI